MKKHRDFVVYVRQGVAINALVAVSRDIYIPATQDDAARTEEHLTVVYLDPASASASPTGDQLRASVKTQFDVPPLVEGALNGWTEVPNLTGIAPEGTKVNQGVPTLSANFVLSAVAAEQKVAEATNVEVAPFSIGAKVHFSPTSGNDPSPVYTVKGIELGAVDGHDNGAIFNTLEEISGLFLPQSLSSAEAKIEPTSNDPEIPESLPETPTTAVSADKAISGPDGMTDAERGYLWGSEDHKAALSKLLSKSSEPTDLGETATEQAPVEDTHADEIADAENNHGQGELDVKPEDVVQTDPAIVAAATPDDESVIGTPIAADPSLAPAPIA